jgi:eukaryotic-like serine/threonine-protein kinase
VLKLRTNITQDYHKEEKNMSELIGKTIGQYQLVEVINETGTALVYKGFQPAFNRYVAVKILKPSAARNQEAVQLFRQEGDLLAQFHHPRLLEVYETGEVEGLVYRAERLAENGSLQNHLGSGTQNPFYDTNRLINLFQEIVEGLEFIHSQGYIHGNLTSGNILLDAMMHPLLSDIGLPGRPGMAGSPYLAPEQVQGGMIDHRADVYALGVLLYTTLVGIAPPTGMVVSPRSSRPDVPEGVERVIFKAMAQAPDQRFQSASEFFNAMRSAFVIPPPPPPPVYTPAPPVAPMPIVSQTVNVAGQKKGANWVAIILGVFLVLVLCIGAIFIYRMYSQNQSAAPEAPTQVPPVIILPSQPPAVTQVLPTREPRPTNEPPPTQPPDQPTTPAEQPTQPEQQPLPTQPPDQPTTPAEQPTQPPQIEQPIYPPVQERPRTDLPFCGSVGLIGAPLVVIGANRLSKKKRGR